jgi:hypothetical protein
MTAPTWRVDRMTGFRISHPFAAHAPGCPDGPHPTRSCLCRVFRTTAEAEAYIAEQTAVSA